MEVWKNPWLYFWVGVVILLIYLIIPKGAPGQYDEFASCLTDKGVIMYGTDWCPHCKNQKSLFGNSFKKVKYVNCEFNGAECERNGVTSYPTWKVNGDSFLGVQALPKLAQLSGCSIN